MLWFLHSVYHNSIMALAIIGAMFLGSVTAYKEHRAMETGKRDGYAEAVLAMSLEQVSSFTIQGGEQ